MIMADISEYKVGVILSVEDIAAKNKGGKTLKTCLINIGRRRRRQGGGDDDDADADDDGDNSDTKLTVVTAAPNVRAGSRVAVAPVGSTVITEEGEELKIQKTAVGGVMSEGMLCDSRMLGWTGGAAGIAVQIPESVEIGSAPPATKPRPNDGGGGGEDAAGGPPPPVAEGLFQKKLTKEEKKKLAAEKRAAKKAAKESATEES